jgi:hypothetical protein
MVMFLKLCGLSAATTVVAGVKASSAIVSLAATLGPNAEPDEDRQYDDFH